MAEVNPLKLHPTGAGQAELREFAAGDTLPKAALPPLEVADVSGLSEALAGKVGTSDASLTDAREWTAATVTQAEAEAGTATTRRAWTALRVRQAVAAWWTTVSTAFGRSLVGAANAGAGRAALELGTAASANTTTSSTDATGGRILKVGDFGTGVTVIPPLLGDLDATTTPSGTYFVSNLTLNIASRPTGTSDFNVVEIRRYDALQVIQTFYQRQASGTGVVSWSRGYNHLTSTWGAWAIQFNSRTILGAVSQSAGVPTGAIIERGSNANGEYVRFADGTQICTRSASGALTTTPYGSALHQSTVGTWTFPAPFSTTVGLVVGGSGADAGAIGWTSATSLNVNSASIRYITITANPSTSAICTVAIGRWY